VGIGIATSIAATAKAMGAWWGSSGLVKQWTVQEEAQRASAAQVNFKGQGNQIGNTLGRLNDQATIRNRLRIRHYKKESNRRSNEGSDVTVLILYVSLRLKLKTMDEIERIVNHLNNLEQRSI
jgi:hypothetical protein